LRLLLDEQYSPEIAARLRRDGYDVTAVNDDPGLEGMDDEPLLRRATADGRALLTNNVRDFAPLAKTWAAGEEEHLGLIFTSDESLPRSRNTIGTYVERLRELLDRSTADEAFRGRVEWLR
jgi:predicted nuclease of predicted toxin-antitoxin system